MTIEYIIIYILVYLAIFAFFTVIFYNEQLDGKITMFDNIVLSLFWPISLPYKLIKTFIEAIKKTKA